MKIPTLETVTSTAKALGHFAVNAGTTASKLTITAGRNAGIKAKNHFDHLSNPTITNYEVSATASLFLLTVFFLYILENGKLTTISLLGGAAVAGVTGVKQYGGFDKAINYFKPAQPVIEQSLPQDLNPKKTS
jgi:hypothetical protein